LAGEATFAGAALIGALTGATAFFTGAAFAGVVFFAAGFAGAALGAGFEGALPAVALAEADLVGLAVAFTGAAFFAGFLGAGLALGATFLAAFFAMALDLGAGFTGFFVTALPPGRAGFFGTGFAAAADFALAAGFAGWDLVGAGRAGAFFALVAAFFTGLDCFLDIVSKRAHRARGKVTKSASLPSRRACPPVRSTGYICRPFAVDIPCAGGM
jgi:hypothetical protein